MDMLEFTRRSTGMEDEYQKVLKSIVNLIQANGRTKEALDDRRKELARKKEDLLEFIQSEMTEISLQERALAEIRLNWNYKAYWGEE